MDFNTKIYGVKCKKQWAVFAPNGYIQYCTISDTQKEAKLRTMRDGSDLNWESYAVVGYTTNKILLDIKLLSK